MEGDDDDVFGALLKFRSVVVASSRSRSECTRTVERSAKTKRRRRAMRTRLGDIVQDSFTSNVYASPVASGQISQSGGLFDQPANPIPDWAWFVGGAIVALFVFGGKR